MSRPHNHQRPHEDKRMRHTRQFQRQPNSIQPEGNRAREFGVRLQPTTTPRLPLAGCGLLRVLRHIKASAPACPFAHLLGPYRGSFDSIARILEATSRSPRVECTTRHVVALVQSPKEYDTPCGCYGGFRARACCSRELPATNTARTPDAWSNHILGRLNQGNDVPRGAFTRGERDVAFRGFSHRSNEPRYGPGTGGQMDKHGKWAFMCLRTVRSSRTSEWQPGCRVGAVFTPTFASAVLRWMPVGCRWKLSCVPQRYPRGRWCACGREHTEILPAREWRRFPQNSALRRRHLPQAHR